MALYRRRPPLVDAIQWRGDNIADIQNFLGSVILNSGRVQLFTPAGNIYVEVTDWIVRDTYTRELSRASDALFKAMYEVEP